MKTVWTTLPMKMQHFWRSHITAEVCNENNVEAKNQLNFKADSERSLLILAHCLTRVRSFENAYHLLKTVGNPTGGAAGLKTPKCRYLFAYCAFTLNR